MDNEVSLPSEMVISGRIYEILGFLKENEKLVSGKTMVERAKEMKACLGREDCQHILEHQNEIPAALRDKVCFVFTDWRHPVGSGVVACVDWGGGRWVLDWGWFARDWGGYGRVLRRKS